MKGDSNSRKARHFIAICAAQRRETNARAADAKGLTSIRNKSPVRSLTAVCVRSSYAHP